LATCVPVQAPGALTLVPPSGLVLVLELVLAGLVFAEPELEAESNASPPPPPQPAAPSAIANRLAASIERFPNWFKLNEIMDRPVGETFGPIVGADAERRDRDWTRGEASATSGRNPCLARNFVTARGADPC
jgi:hypothetical protein